MRGGGGGLCAAHEEVKGGPFTNSGRLMCLEKSSLNFGAGQAPEIPQRAQYCLLKEYSLNHIGILNMI